MTMEASPHQLGNKLLSVYLYFKYISPVILSNFAYIKILQIICSKNICRENLYEVKCNLSRVKVTYEYCIAHKRL